MFMSVVLEEEQADTTGIKCCVPCLFDYRCMVIEDSLIGLEAALGATMNCVITHTESTKAQVGCRSTSRRDAVGTDNLQPTLSIRKFKWYNRLFLLTGFFGGCRSLSGVRR